MYIVTTSQMQAAEKAANAAGLSYEQMMENAGHAVAQAIAAHFDITGALVLVLVGPGNNGGDGLVVARYLAQLGAIVTVYVWQRRLQDDKNWALLDATDVDKLLSNTPAAPTRLAHLLNEAAIIVDALLGTGASRPIDGALAELLDQTKATVTTRRAYQDGLLVDPTLPTTDDEFGPAVVAVDLPSGLNSDTGAVDPHTLPADLTVTLAAVKRGHILLPGAERVGQLVVADIGLSASHFPTEVRLQMATAAKVAALLPPRPIGAHKGTFGKALLVAGSTHYTGAALLAGQSATRSGAGLVTLAPPRAIYPILATRLPEATYLPLPDHDGAISPAAIPVLKERFNNADALLIGPGLGQAEPTAAFLSQLLTGAHTFPPLVIDADALNILAQQAEWWRLLPPNSILTPHPGEMARLMGCQTADVQANRLEIAAAMAVKWGQIVLLKGAHTVIAASDGRTIVLPFANPALAKGGSGDVLAGVIVGLRAQGMAAFEAAIAGAYLHGLTGELVREYVGITAAIAGDLVDYLPLAIREVRGE